MRKKDKKNKTEKKTEKKRYFFLFACIFAVRSFVRWVFVWILTCHINTFFIGRRVYARRSFGVCLLDDKCWITWCHNVFFTVRVCNLILFGDNMFLQNFQCKCVLFIVLYEFDTSKTANAECTNNFQIGQLNVIVFCLKWANEKSAIKFMTFVRFKLVFTRTDNIGFRCRYDDSFIGWHLVNRFFTELTNRSEIFIEGAATIDERKIDLLLTFCFFFLFPKLTIDQAPSTLFPVHWQ